MKIRPLSEEEKLDWLRLFRTENVGPITFYKLLKNFGTVKKAIEEIPNMAKLGGKMSKLKVPSVDEIKDEYKKLQKIGGCLVCACEPEYSNNLRNCPDAPPVLSCLGNINLLTRKNISIVGSRHPSINSRTLTKKMASELGQQGFVISSGFASGIDTCAHMASLESGTIAVLGGGIDVIYPSENKDLYEELFKKGLIISEVPFGTKPLANHFPKRNRIIAGLSSACVVIEAKLKSGSLHTAKQAFDYNREVLAVPGSAMDPKAKGTNLLIQRNQASLVMSANDVIDAINHMIEPLFKDFEEDDFDFKPMNEKKLSEKDLLNTQDILLRDYLDYAPVSVNQIIEESEISANLIISAILNLELAGKIERNSGDMVMLISEDD